MYRRIIRSVALVVLLFATQQCANGDRNENVVGSSGTAKLLSTSIVGDLTSGGTALPVFTSGTLPPGGGPSGVVQKPCASRMGSAHPDQGSGNCSGNLYTEVALPTTGLTLSHNSLAANINYGFGYGFSLSIDSRFIVLSPTQGLYIDGNGTTLTFHSISNTGGVNKFLSDDLRILNATFSVCTGSASERFLNGTTLTYTQLANDKSQYVLSKIVDRNSNITALTRDTNGLISKITDPFGNAVSITYSAGSVSVVDPAKNAYTISLDSNSRVTSVKQPDGRMWSFTYDADSIAALFASSTSVDGEALQYTYYLSGDVESITNSLGYVTLLTYTSSSVTTQTAFDKDIETFDTAGRLWSLTHNGVTQNYSRDPSGRVVSSTDPLGLATTYTYDTTDPLVSGFTAPHGATGAIVRDSNRNTTKTTFSQGQMKTVTNFDPTQYGFVRSIVRGATGQDTMNFAYTTGNLISVTRNGKVVASYTYDIHGLLTTATDSRGLTKKFAYNVSGLLNTTTDSLGRVFTYTHDSVGNILQINTPTMVFTNQYDQVGTPIGTSSMAGVSSSSGKVTNQSSVSYFSSGAPSDYTATTTIGGTQQSKYEETFQGPAYPGNTTSRVLTDSQGVSYDYAK